MQLQFLAIAAALTGLSAATPKGWSNLPTFPGPKPTHYPTAPGASTVTVTATSCASATVSTVTVTESWSWTSGAPSASPSFCLTDAKATQIINTYETLINRDIHGAEFNATANALLSDSYILLSNAINADEGLPVSPQPSTLIEAWSFDFVLHPPRSNPTHTSCHYLTCSPCL